MGTHHLLLDSDGILNLHLDGQSTNDEFKAMLSDVRGHGDRAPEPACWSPTDDCRHPAHGSL